MYPIDALPPDAIFELRSRELMATAPETDKEEKPRTYSQKAKTIACTRQALLLQWKQVTDGKAVVEASRAFLNAYNTNGAPSEGSYLPEIHRVLGDTTLDTLYRWARRPRWREDYMVLVPQHHGRGASGYPKLTQDERTILEAFVMSPNRLSIRHAVRMARMKWASMGVAVNRSDRTYERYLEWYRKNHKDEWTLWRDGEKAAVDQVVRAMQRDASLLRVGEVLVADGHRLNLMVRHPFTGKPCRATLVGYLDWHSYDLVGYEIMLEENVQAVASALRNAILFLGIKPRVCFQDNGKAFRAKYFMGTPDLSYPLRGLFARLGIHPMFAKPYAAASKPVEGFWRILSDQLERLIPSFSGANINDKPARMKRNEKLHRELFREYVPTVDEVVKAINSWLAWRRENTVCPHDPERRTIAEVLQYGERYRPEDSSLSNAVDPAELDDLMMVAQKAQVGRNGVRFRGKYYWNEALYGLQKTMVIHYSLFDSSTVRVYEETGEFVCEARVEAPFHPLATLDDPEDMKRLRASLAENRRLLNGTIARVKAKHQAFIELCGPTTIGPLPLGGLPAGQEDVSPSSLPQPTKQLPAPHPESTQAVPGTWGKSSLPAPSPARTTQADDEFRAKYLEALEAEHAANAPTISSDQIRQQYMEILERDRAAWEREKSDKEASSLPSVR